MMKNGLFTAIRFCVYALSAVLFIPFLKSQFGFGVYGLIAVAGFLTQYVGIIQSCTGSAVARFLNIALNQNDAEQANQIFSTALCANIGFVILQLPLFILLIWKFDWIFDFPPEVATDFRILVACNIAVFCISIFTGVLTTPIQAANKLYIISIIDCLRLALRLILLFVLIVTIGPRLWIIGGVYLGLSIVNAIAIFIMYRRTAPDLVFRRKYITRKWVRPVLNMAGWSILTALGSFVFVKTDIWMINRFVNKEIAGVYAVLLVWPNFLRQVSKQLASLLTPVYMIDFARGNTGRVARLSLSSAKLLGCFVGLCVGVVCVIAEPILGLWLHTDMSPYLNLFYVMLIYLVFTIGEAVLWQIFTTINKVHFTGIASILAGIMNIVVSLSLIHAGYGAMGVAVGTAVSSICASALAIPLGVCREFKIPYRQLCFNYISAVLMMLFSMGSTYLSWWVMKSSVLGGIISFSMLMCASLFFAAKVILSDDERELFSRLIESFRKKIGWAG